MRRLTIFLFSFVFARGMLFISPILLANLLPSSSYGLVEGAHAAASLTSTIAVMGASAVLPLIVLKDMQRGTMMGIFVHHIAVVLVCLVLVCVALWLDDAEPMLLAALLTATLALQVLWSTHLKAHGKGEASMLLDASLFTLMALAAATANCLHAADSLLWIAWVVAGYAVCLFGITVFEFFKQLWGGEVVAYQAILVLGLPLMIASLVTVAATTSGRLVIGYLGGALLTADYAILARAAALPIVAHQIVVVAKFRHLFTLPNREMEQVVVLIIGMVVLSVVGLWIVSPVLGWILGPAFAKALQRYPLPALWILSQSILWSGIALHDMINTRHQTMGKVLPWSTSFLVVLALVAIAVIKYVGVTLPHFVYVHGVFMLLFYIAQIFVMYKAGIRLLRAWSFTVFSYIALVVLASLMY